MKVHSKKKILKYLMLAGGKLLLATGLASLRCARNVRRRLALWFSLIVLALVWAIVGYRPALGGDLSTAYHKVVLTLMLLVLVVATCLLAGLYVVFRRRKALFALLMATVFCFFLIRVPTIQHRAQFGLNGAVIVNGHSDDTCAIRHGVPWIDLAPRRLLNFFTGSEQCDDRGDPTRFTLDDHGRSVRLHCAADERGSLLLYPAYDFYADRTSTIEADLIDAPNETLARMKPERSERRIVADRRGDVVMPLTPDYGEFFEAQCGQRPSALVLRHLVDTQRYEHLLRQRGNHARAKKRRRTKRRAPRQADAEDRPLNVLVLMLDGVSRVQFYRSLPRTAQLLASWQRGVNDGIDVFEFFRYHTIAGSTRHALTPMLMGMESIGGDSRERRQLYEQTPFVWQRAAIDRYATMFGVEQCVDYVHDYWGGALQRPYERGGYRVAGIDHSLWQPFCHADYNGMSNFVGPYSLKRRCIGETPVHRFAFDYIEQFWRNYAGVGRFAFVAMMEGHEGSLEVLHTVDDDLHALLDAKLSGTLANDTALWLIGDHGNHMSPYFYFSHAGWQERSLPISMLLMPSRSLDKATRRHLTDNQQRLFTQYDVYATLAELLSMSVDGSLLDEHHGDQYAHHNHTERSLLHKLDAHETCESLQIPERLCACVQT